MTDKSVIALDQVRPRIEVDAGAVLDALAAAVVVVGGDGCVLYVNAAAEQFFGAGAQQLRGRRLSGLLPADSPLFALMAQARRSGGTVSEYGMTLDTPRIGTHALNVQATVPGDEADRVVLVLQERSLADRIERQLSLSGATRSLSAMAAMLAHEVKNPLSGIRGAAQLLEQTAAAEDRTLTALIRDEADRICALIDRMEEFSDSGPLPRRQVNVHRILDRVRRLAENGFGRHVRFVEAYDPSLPPVLGNHDQLVQVFLNLVKNAAEAVPATGAEIVLATAYRHDVRLTVPGSGTRVPLPLEISIRDNGEGIAEDMKGHLFDPFVTTKPKGSGLGLALVAKIVGDHGGVIEFDSRPRRTTFRVRLPMAGGPEAA